MIFTSTAHAGRQNKPFYQQNLSKPRRSPIPPRIILLSLCARAEKSVRHNALHKHKQTDECVRSSSAYAYACAYAYAYAYAYPRVLVVMMT